MPYGAQYKKKNLLCDKKIRKKTLFVNYDLYESMFPIFDLNSNKTTRVSIGDGNSKT